MFMKYYIAIILLLILFSSCIEQPDNYKVYYDSMIPGLENNVLMCKLACNSDAIIDGVKKIEWSDKEMYVLQKKNEQENYFILIAKGQKLTCCNNDIIIGPLTLYEFKTKIFELRLPEELNREINY